MWRTYLIILIYHFEYFLEILEEISQGVPRDSRQRWLSFDEVHYVLGSFQAML
jgi:hypothetical protein